MLAYFLSLGVVAGFEPESTWAPSEHFIYPLGTPTVFFNSEGLLFYSDEQEIFSEALAATTIAAAANLLSILKGSGTVSELGQIGRLAAQALRASGYNLESQVAISQATGGRY